MSEPVRLSVLDNLHIAAPCKASWADMTGDDRARFCGQCEKNVYDLSAMSRPEAEALLIEKEGKLCVRYYQRADGTILTADCPDGVARRNRKRRLIAVSFGAMSAIAAFAPMFTRAPLAMQGAVVKTTVETPAVVQAEAIQGGITLPVDPPPVLMGRVSSSKPTKPKVEKPKPQMPLMGKPMMMGEPRPLQGHVTLPKSAK